MTFQEYIKKLQWCLEQVPESADFVVMDSDGITTRPYIDVNEKKVWL